MKCVECEPWLAAKADGSLDVDRAQLLDAHLAGCDACRAALEDQAFVRNALASALAVAPRPDFAARVRARLDADEGWLGLTDFRAWTLRLAPLAAAIALIAMLWPAEARTAAPANSNATAVTFRPASIDDWNRDVSPNALLAAALREVPGDSHVR